MVAIGRRGSLAWRCCWVRLPYFSESDRPVSASLEYERRLYCAVHPDMALARVVGVDRLVCVVCSTIRAAHLAGALFDYVAAHPCEHEPRCWAEAQRSGGNTP
jgi:hypothetical protein